MTYYEHHLRFLTIIDERISILFNLLFSKQSSASESKSLSCVRLLCPTLWDSMDYKVHGIL